MSYQHLSESERTAIYYLDQEGLGHNEIGRRLGRDKGTISREMRRNRKYPQRDYWPEVAQDLAMKRRRKARRPSKQENKPLYRLVIKALKKDFSPDVIAGRLKLEFAGNPGMWVSHETIYRWTYQDAKAGGELYRCLAKHHKKRRKQRRYGDMRRFIVGRVSIHKRPAIVERRSRLGDFESDSVLGTKGTGGIASHVDRKSRYLIAAKLTTLHAEHYAKQTQSVFKKIDLKKCKTMTCDNGREFAQFKKIEKKLELKVYFADPYSSWQRGTNENTNGLLRRYFPKKKDFTEITYQALAKVVEKINNRPRKILGYRTPHEVFNNTTTVALRV